MKSERNYGIDLLRMLAMVFIVTLHTLLHGGILDSCKNSFQFISTNLIYSIAYCGVNVFAIISGFVAYDSSLNKDSPRYKFQNIIILWFEVVFYSLLCTVITSVLQKKSLSYKSIIIAIMPISNDTYWYFTSYFILFLLSPLLIYLVRESTLSSARVICCSGLFLLYLSHTISGMFGSYLLIFLFIIGSMIRKYELHQKISIKKCSVLLLFLWCINWLWNIVFQFIGYISIGKILIRYDSPTIIGVAILLCLLFANITISNSKLKNLIKMTTPSVFAVYLLNDHPLVRELIIKNRFCFFVDNTALLLMFVLLFPLAFFVLSIFIDCIRRGIFRLLRVNYIISYSISLYSKIVNSFFNRIKNLNSSSNDCITK